ncbi:hypothetical protein HPB52_003020 [Rhipicephalus sanguineus]|uniref:Uncharacterized protein n=1 Tax=Rhipicephalus sanguineus TaxID=34632 RepID=A0A9D4SVH1_RHISA|nr:hypothetical protein HPB52_003020 [Rhipicephalus sanguineus]
MPEKCPTLKFVKLTEHARAPTRGSTAAAGFDLYRYLPVAAAFALLTYKLRFQKVAMGVSHHARAWLPSMELMWASLDETERGEGGFGSTGLRG